MQFRALLFLVSLCGSFVFSQQLVVKGKVEGFPKLVSDDVIHGAVVFPALTPRELVSLQLENLLAPNESMTAGPETLQVPGNLFVPNQKESYGIFPISMVKAKYSALVTNQEPRELVALQFKAPFTKLVDLARKKAHYTEMLQLVSTESLGLTANTLWNANNSNDVSIPLNSKISQAQMFMWDRLSSVPKNEFDMVINFQKTQTGRWTPVSFAGKIPKEGKLNFNQGLSPEKLSLFTRMTHNEKGSLVMTQVKIVKTQNTDQKIVAQGLPSVPSEWSLNTATSRLSWKNSPEKKGWVTAVRQEKKSQLSTWSQFEHPLSQLVMRFSDWTKRLQQNSLNSQMLGWHPISQGEIPLQPGLAVGDSVVFIQVETAENVLSPEDDSSDEPQIFSLAEGLVMKTFEVLK